MKPSPPATRRRLVALSLLSFSTALVGAALRAAEAAPTIARSAVNAPVTLTDDGATWTLDNGIVRATVLKRSGQISSLTYHGTPATGDATLQGRGNWEEDGSAAATVGGLTAVVTIDPAKNGGKRAEVSVKGVTGGKVALSVGSPGSPNGTSNIDLEIRCAIGQGESGLYTYAIFSHPAAYGPVSIGESRFILAMNREFDWISVDADRNMLECAPTDWGTGVVVHAKEQRIMSEGVYKNSVEHKYSYNAIQYKIPAYGWSSTKNHVGVWFINPTIEFLSGGATKQELVCHFGDNANPPPIILDYWRGTHYGGGATCSIAAGEEWNKVIGPIFIYVNALDRFATPPPAALETLAATAGNPTVPAAWKNNATVLWQDALAQAKKETAQWPYGWVNGVDYPHQHERGSVRGQIVLKDPQAASAKLPHLTIGLAYPHPLNIDAGGNSSTPPPPPAPADAPAPGRGGFGFARRTMDWAHDAKNYQFWTDGTEDGKFTITKARPGKYTLHAFADGVLGEFARADVVVEAGKTVDLGKLEWKPLRHGKQLWEIGVPNRNASEFHKGDGNNYWLWGWPLRYALLYPNDLSYTVGKSDWHKDWFFEQVPHAENLSFVNPEAKDPANQKFGWVKAESRTEFATTDRDAGVWAKYGRGRATTWTIKFNVSKATHGVAALRLALAGADGQGGLTVAVNGKAAGAIRPASTNALRYNTDKGIWQEQAVKFDAALLKTGENEITLTVPAGDVTTGVVYDYLRLELDENAKLEGAQVVAN